MSTYSETQEGFEAGSAATTRPAFITDEHLEFLDDLRESGATNMFGARPYLKRFFRKLKDDEAATILSYWMKTFGKETR